MTRVFLFPSPLQHQLIAELAPAQSSPVVAVFTGSKKPPSSEQVQTYLVPEFLEWMGRQPSDQWCCCNELAVYFVALHRERAGQLAFASTCLDMLTKLEMHAALCRAGVSSLPKTPLNQLKRPLSRPVIVKPNFGFASTLVQRIGSDVELDVYLSSYDQLRQQSIVAPYQLEYLSRYRAAELEQILVEPDVSTGVFLSVPFVVTDGRLASSWPVVGAQHEKTADTHFRWLGFRAPAGLTEEIRSRLDATLDALARAFTCGSLICEAEIIIDPCDGTPWVLEFSPRVTGGSIPQLIYHAHGIDLERLMIALALEIDLPAPTLISRECLLIRRHDNEQAAAALPGEVLEAHRKQLGSEAFIDEVRALAPAHAPSRPAEVGD